MILEIHNFTQNEIDEKFFKSIAEKCLKNTEVKDKQIEISLAIVGNNRMRRLNKMYRGKNRVTDVLSFGDKSVLQFLQKAFPKLKKNEIVEERFVQPPDKIKRLGEVIICYPQAKKQARRLSHSLEEELTILFVHGILHLLGYEHEEDEQREKMQKLEKKILNSTCLPAGRVTKFSTSNGLKIWI